MAITGIEDWRYWNWIAAEESRSQKWYEPEWWKFGDIKSYFCHASAPIIISFIKVQALQKRIDVIGGLSLSLTHIHKLLYKIWCQPVPIQLIYFLRCFLLQKPFVLVYDLFALWWWIKVKPDVGRWFKRHESNIHEMFAACTM
ncbi:uncharacterized protein LOC112198320 isoform X1 [Rosa chinensis]|uniref:uncharacterized protein LOC112198320 isoform X1 n=1 Tax=Rosa chinensis TaxID=74649 RepID=UPI001AD8A392|nr:uncharacterized protein LOC112198320 isoform X1 [Rosa chinensis]XP_040374309.1 uncharacterized protein LOC112198320 isoform X1 [Rosa chinensis]